MGLFSNDDTVYLENADLDCQPQNGYVTKKSVSKIDDILDKGEKVHFLGKEAGGGIEVKGNGESEEQKVGTGGHVRTAATDRRVVSKIPKIVGSEEVSIPYDSIATVDYKSAFVKTRLSLQTSMTTYRIDIGYLSDEESNQMYQFVREKVAEANQQERTTSQNEETSDPLDQLERLRDLYNDGVVTEAEFEEKKRQLLEQI